jgi:hypothetical protein
VDYCGLQSTELAHLCRISGFEQRKITLKTTLIEDFFVPLLIKRRAKDDVFLCDARLSERKNGLSKIESVPGRFHSAPKTLVQRKQYLHLGEDYTMNQDRKG